MKENLKLGVKMFLFGIGIILFCVGWGLNYSLIMLSIAEFYDTGYIDESTYSFVLYGVPIIGISILISITLWLGFSSSSFLRPKSQNNTGVMQ